MEMIKGVHRSEIPFGIDHRFLYKTSKAEYAIDIAFNSLEGLLFIKSRQTGKIYKVTLSGLVEEAIKQGIDDNSEEVSAEYSDEERRVIDCIAASYEEGEQ